MELKLRDYQTDAVNYARYSIRKGNKRPLIVAPTGSGKSVIIAEIVANSLKKGARVEIITHSAELVKQNYLTFCKWFPDLASRAGMFSSSLGDEYDKDAVFCTIQTLSARIDKLPSKPTDLVLIDEAHRVSVDSKQYGGYLKHLQNNGTKYFIGLTATPFRTDKGCLVNGNRAFFDDIGYKIEMSLLVERGILVPPVVVSVPKKIDTSIIKKNSSGEYSESSQEEAIYKFGLEEIILSALDEGSERKSFIWFFPSVLVCEKAKQILDKLGERSGIVVGDTSQDKRQDILTKHKNWDIKHLLNVQVLTTGYDDPRIDCLVLLRKTSSKVLYIQINGRPARKGEGKVDFLAIDYMRNFEEHGLIDDPNFKIMDTSKSDKKKKKTKECVECNRVYQVSKPRCPSCNTRTITCRSCGELNNYDKIKESQWGKCVSCGKSFFGDFKFNQTENELISENKYNNEPWEISPRWIPVDKMEYEHVKANHPWGKSNDDPIFKHDNHLAFRYHCGGQVFSEKHYPYEIYKGGFSWHRFVTRMDRMGLTKWQDSDDLIKYLKDNYLPNYIRVGKKKKRDSEIYAIRTN